MKYIVTGKSVSITGGVLTLSEAQAADRAHCLKKLSGKNQYEILETVIFKNGEKFGFDGKLPKSIGVDLEAEKAAAEKAAAEKAAAEKAAAEKAAAEKAAAEKAEAEKK